MLRKVKVVKIYWHRGQPEFTWYFPGLTLGSSAGLSWAWNAAVVVNLAHMLQQAVCITKSSQSFAISGIEPVLVPQG